MHLVLICHYFAGVSISWLRHFSIDIDAFKCATCACLAKIWCIHWIFLSIPNTWYIILQLALLHNRTLKVCFQDFWQNSNSSYGSPVRWRSQSAPSKNEPSIVCITLHDSNQYNFPFSKRGFKSSSECYIVFALWSKCAIDFCVWNIFKTFLSTSLFWSAIHS